jgi:type VI secretion system protein ImpA
MNERSPEPSPDPFALALISADDPCGPDLDLEGDAEFLNFVAAMEVLLPGKEPRYFYEFKHDSIDFPTAVQAAEKLLTRSLDVRLIALAAKLSILNRDIGGFARWLGSLAWVLGEQWDGVHPRGEGNDYSARRGQLMTLEETSTVVLPLQYSPLLETQREGALSYRDQLIATGAAQPRSVTIFDEKGEQRTTADEKFMPQKTIERLLKAVEIKRLAAAFDTLRGLSISVQSIKAISIERVGFENAVELPRLDKLVREMTEFLRSALNARDPTLAPPTEQAREKEESEAIDAAALPPAFASRAEVDTALASALGYFAVNEPSSPAVLLIRQARETLGKNLYEVMKLLAPPYADNARVFVGPDGAFTVAVRSLSNVPSAETEQAPSAPAPSRAAALALIDAVAAHTQRAEPSSPVPYLLERARALASRDFLSLLDDMLPEDDLASLKKGR